MLAFRNSHFRFELPVHFEREDASGNRFTVVIGGNGSGKSKLLRAIVESSLASVNLSPFIGGDRGFEQVLALSNLVTDLFPMESNKQDGRYRYLGLRQASNSVTTGALSLSTAQFLATCLLESRRTSALSPAFKAIGIRACNVRIRPGSRVRDEGYDLLRSIERLGGSARDEAAVRVSLAAVVDKGQEPGYSWIAELARLARLWSLSVPDVLTVLRRSGLANLSAYVKMGRGEADVASLSTGQLLLLSTCARIAASLEDRSVVLIDEPEVGLHPTWQAEYLAILRDTVNSFVGSHFFIATHSPHLVSDASDVLVPGPQWGTFGHFEDPFFGRSVENILYRVFGVSTPGNPLVEQDLDTLLRTIAESSVREVDLGDAERALNRLGTIAGPDTTELNQLLQEASSRIAETK